MGVEELISRYRSWVVKGGWTVLDQGLFSGANFLVNILLARWLPPREYGAFATSQYIFFLITAFHTAVLTEPMLIFGVKKYKDNFREYLGVLLYEHIFLSIIVFLVLSILIFLMKCFNVLEMFYALKGVLFSFFFVLLFWLSRRSCYAIFKPYFAAFGSFLNLVLLSFFLFFLYYNGILSTFSAFIVLGISAVFSSLFLFLYLKPQLLINKNILFAMLKDHLNYGSWNILNLLSKWISSNIVFILIPILLGLTANAVYSAVWNLFRPLSLIIQSASLILLPLFSNLANSVDKFKFKLSFFKLWLFFLFFFLLYTIIMFLFGDTIMNYVYNGKYKKHEFLIIEVGLFLSLSVGINIFVMALKSIDGVRLVKKIWVTSLMFIIIFFYPLVKIYKLHGAIFSLIIAYFFSVIIAYFCLIKQLEVFYGETQIKR